MSRTAVKQELRCPKCGKNLKKRKGRFGFFLGCEGFPSCRTYVPLQQKEEARPEKEFTPSAYQQGIFDWAEKGTGNALVEAVAGSGKTTTLVQLMRRLPKDSSVVFCAFNKHIATELSKRVPPGMEAATLHSLGWAGIRAWNPNVRLSPDGNSKLGLFVDVEVDRLDFTKQPEPAKAKRTAADALRRIVSLVKAALTDPNDRGAVAGLVSAYQVEVNGGFDMIFPLVATILEECRKETAVVDYDDMIWFPLVHPIALRQYDWVLVDEAQDLNLSQQKLVRCLMRRNTRVVFVGDRHQAIYGFRGADYRSMERIEKEFECKTLPLSICYRCPVSHVKLAKELVPHIEAAPGAAEGITQDAYIDELETLVKPGDLAVCRYNAPLVQPAMALIRNKIKAVIRGREIGVGLVAFIKKLGVKDINELAEKAEQYMAKEVVKMAKKNRPTDQIQDKVDTVLMLAGECGSISELIATIETLFSDSAAAVVFSSIHKAKGLEADRVFFLHPDRIPSKKAVTEAQIRQENNLKYVALTRSRKDLFFCFTRKEE